MFKIIETVEISAVKYEVAKNTNQIMRPAFIIVFIKSKPKPAIANRAFLGGILRLTSESTIPTE